MQGSTSITFAGTANPTLSVTASSTLTFGSSVLLGGTFPLTGSSSITFAPAGTLTDASAPVVEATETTTGGWGAYNAFDSYSQRKAWREKKRKKLLEQIEQIQDQVDREIAELLHEDDLSDSQDVEELRQIVSQDFSEVNAEIAAEFSERLAKAYIRAATQQNYSALKAFEREMDRMREEEEFLVLSILMAE